MLIDDDENRKRWLNTIDKNKDVSLDNSQYITWYGIDGVYQYTTDSNNNVSVTLRNKV